jgi:hypothetical protein
VVQSSGANMLKSQSRLFIRECGRSDPEPGLGPAPFLCGPAGIPAGSARGIGELNRLFAGRATARKPGGRFRAEFPRVSAGHGRDAAREVALKNPGGVCADTGRVPPAGVHPEQRDQAARAIIGVGGSKIIANSRFLPAIELINQ